MKNWLRRQVTTYTYTEPYPYTKSHECREAGGHHWDDPDGDDTTCRRCSTRRVREWTP